MNAFTRAVALCGVIAVPAGLAAAITPTGREVGWGSATAVVLRYTGDPLEGMPVYVVPILPPDDGASTVQIFKSGPDGRALLTPLEAGTYECYVDWNNNQSNVERFEINGNTDYHPVVTLYFNPDIDDPEVD